MADSNEGIQDNDKELEEPNFLSMSDEDILNYDPSKLSTTEVPEVTTQTVANDSELLSDVVDEGATVVPEVEDSKVDEEVKTEVVVNQEHKDFYDRVTAPFKANGTTMQVKSAEDAIALMQMGANYNKKMADLKQPRQLMKMLEDQGLLDEGKLSFLIDLHNKNPNAIAKLLKESNLDIYDVDSQEKADSYVPTVSAPNQETMVLQDVMDELKDQPNYPRVLNAIAYEFDEASRSAVASNPQILRDLTEHASNGIYDQIMAYIRSEQVFGRMQGTTLQMYQAAGNALHQQGKLVGSTPTAAAVVVPVVTKDDAELNARRLAAGAGGKPSPAKSAPVVVNPLSMSEKEFAEYAKTIV